MKSKLLLLSLFILFTFLAPAFAFAADVGGTVYSDEGTTPLASVNVSVSINGAALATMERDRNWQYAITDLVGL